MKFNRQRLVFGLFVLAFIVITELVVGYFRLPGWPAYLAWVLFFIEHMNPKQVAPILIGAAVGLVLILLAGPVIGALTPLLGQWAKLVYVLAVVYSIFAFGEMIPLVLNNYTFMFITVAAVALAAPSPNPVTWLLMAVIGGGMLIGATLLSLRLLGGAPAPAH
jgi:hypothetical protein